MLKRLAVLVCLCSYACGTGGTTQPTEVATVRDSGSVSSAGVVTTTTAVPATTPVTNLSAYFKQGVCYVTNQTGSTQAIRYRVSKVVDEADPANYDKQIKVIDQTFSVPNGVKDFAVVAKGEVCAGLYQYDCGRGEGLLAYQFIRHSNLCPTPKPSPTPTPSPTPSPEPTPLPTPTPPPSCQQLGNCPVVLACKYTIDCGKQDSPVSKLTYNNYCVNHSAEAECKAGGGTWARNSKCETPLPGISNKRWQLNPGQSDEACLSKH